MRVTKPVEGAGDKRLTVISITLTPLEAEQLRFEIETLQHDARVKGPILDRVNRDLTDLAIEAAPYPGHREAWPR